MQKQKIMNIYGFLPICFAVLSIMSVIMIAIIINPFDSLIKQRIKDVENSIPQITNQYASNRLQTSDYHIKFFQDPLEGCEYIIVISKTNDVQITPRMLKSGKHACGRN